MPPMHLTNVDLPAPLSPTSAVTSPGYTARETSRRTCTGPKLLLIPRTSSRGVAVTVLLSQGHGRWWRRAARSPPPPGSLLDAGLGALGRVVAGAQLSRRDEAVVDDVLHVVLGDRHRVQQDRRDVLLGLRVGDLAGDGLLLPLGERDREVRRRVGLLLDRLVDGHALVAGQEFLQALHRRVLTGHRHRTVELLLLEHRDRRVAEAVIGGQDALDVGVLGQHLLEGGGRRGVVPLGYRLVRALHVVARVVLRLEYRVVAVLEQRRVVVGRRPVQLGDDRLLRTLVGQALHQALTLQLTDLGVVEADVV